MKKSVINIKVEQKVKKQAQEVAEELGFTLSSLLNAYLKEFVRTKEVSFSLEKELVPSEYLKKSLAETEEDIKKGYVSPAFDTVEESIAWLKDPNARYVNGKRAD